MARSVNKTILLGNLTRDPEVRYTASGVAVATMGLATNENWIDSEGKKQERVEFHSIVVWRKLAEICGEYLKKGSKIYMEGRLQYRNYDDKNGVKRYVTEIVMDELVMLDGKPREAGFVPPATPAPPPGEAGPTTKDDDLPF